MGKFKDLGDPAITLIEEMSEVIKVITKKIRFQEDWDSVPPSDINIWPKNTRWQLLEEEMEDVLYQWERLKKQHYTQQNSEPMRYDIKLFAGLTDDQKVLAYAIMGYVLLDYKREHCVPLDVVRKLQVNELLESYNVVMVMY